MVGVAIALVVIGIAFAFVYTWVGIVLGLAGAVLFVAAVAGFGRRAAGPGA